MYKTIYSNVLSFVLVSDETSQKETKRSNTPLNTKKDDADKNKRANDNGIKMETVPTHPSLLVPHPFYSFLQGMQGRGLVPLIFSVFSKQLRYA